MAIPRPPRRQRHARRCSVSRFRSAGRPDQPVNLPERDVQIDAVERDDIGDEVSDPTNPDRVV